MGILLSKEKKQKERRWLLGKACQAQGSSRRGAGVVSSPPHPRVTAALTAASVARQALLPHRAGMPLHTTPTPGGGGRIAEAPKGSDYTQKPWFADTGIQLRILNRCSQNHLHTHRWEVITREVRWPRPAPGSFEGSRGSGWRPLSSPTTLGGLEDVAGSKPWS